MQERTHDYKQNPDLIIQAKKDYDKEKTNTLVKQGLSHLLDLPMPLLHFVLKHPDVRDAVGSLFGTAKPFAPGALTPDFVARLFPDSAAVVRFGNKITASQARSTGTRSATCVTLRGDGTCRVDQTEFHERGRGDDRTSRDTEEGVWSLDVPAGGKPEVVLTTVAVVSVARQRTSDFTTPADHPQQTHRLPVVHGLPADGLSAQSVAYLRWAEGRDLVAGEAPTAVYAADWGTLYREHEEEGYEAEMDPLMMLVQLEDPVSYLYPYFWLR
eukprot:TRINITY_DN4215_c0_g1_i1.p1 TRINITY_DN4215_c0_g1~~TRINITY_DN4215_c0_g1_i1.p1  ORF type:complete len:270 (+),score=68.65 TRINITY_DN4215_c0_g1_i1:689-1498(+)